MASNGRQSDGRFAPGHKYARGRPPRNYSIAHALSLCAEEGTTDDGGESMTRAQWAAKWLWSVVSSGQDRGKEIGFKERLEALKTILSRIEPEYKLTDKNVDEPSDEEAEKVIEKLENLSDEELSVLEKLATGRKS